MLSENKVFKWVYFDNEICCEWFSYFQYFFVWKFLEVYIRIVYKKGVCRVQIVFIFSFLEGFGFQIYIIKYMKRRERCFQGFYRLYVGIFYVIEFRVALGRSIIFYMVDKIEIVI